EPAPASLLADQVHAATVRVRDLLREVQPQARAGRVGAAAREPSEQVLALAPADAGAVVGHGEADRLAVREGARFHAPAPPAVLDRVVEQVQQRAADGLRVPG